MDEYISRFLGIYKVSNTRLVVFYSALQYGYTRILLRRILIIHNRYGYNRWYKMVSMICVHRMLYGLECSDTIIQNLKEYYW